MSNASISWIVQNERGRVDDAVGVELARHADDVVAAAIVGREDGALDVEVAVGDVVEHLVDGGTVLRDEVLVVAAAGAALLANHHAAGLLVDGPGQVLRGTYLSASSGAHSAPAQRPTSTAPAAVMTPSGT